MAQAGTLALEGIDVAVSAPEDVQVGEPASVGFLCYEIPYRDRFGAHFAMKWAGSPAEAIAKLESQLSGRGIGGAEIGAPALVQPQPFSDESRARRAA